jgi:hypothetical protein
VSEELNELIEMARTIQMTPEQAERQRRSFAYGNVKIENDSITWEMIDRAAEELEKEKSAGGVLLVRSVALRCLNLFMLLTARLKSCPFTKPRGPRVPAPHG